MGVGMMDMREAMEKLRAEHPSIFQAINHLAGEIAAVDQKARADMERIDATVSEPGPREDLKREIWSKRCVAVDPICRERDAIMWRVVEYVSMFPPPPIVVPATSALGEDTSARR